MMNKEEIKYCKFCRQEKPIKEFVKSGFDVKNICRECQNKKQKEIYHNSKKVKDLQQRIDKAIEYIKTHKRQDDFLELNEWGTRDLLEILGGKE